MMLLSISMIYSERRVVMKDWWTTALGLLAGVIVFGRPILTRYGLWVPDEVYGAALGIVLASLGIVAQDYRKT